VALVLALVCSIDQIIEAAEMKPTSEVQYEVREMKIGSECYVSVTRPNSVPTRMDGFANENEAREWIKQQKKN
jgi:hypothetical protein